MNTKKKTDTEFCVNCGARTNYTKDDPINYRYGYVKVQDNTALDAVISVERIRRIKMETSFETTTKNTTSQTWAGFCMVVFKVATMVAVWGEPDQIDAWIYYLSDGYYK